MATDDKDKAQRRVYVLPSELVGRIVAYQNEMGIQSEVEAARRLLDEALMSRDNWRSIARRFKEKLTETRVLSDIAKDILIGHPLVNRVSMEPGSISFGLTTGENIQINVAGEISATDGDGDRISFEPRVSPYERTAGGTSRDLDDEIPF